MSQNIADYSYTFPKSSIAFYPQDKRDHSRLMVLDRKNQKIYHKTFGDIIDYFVPGDVLVLNDSKVFPCRLLTKNKTGGRQEIFLVKKISEVQENTTQIVWQILISNNHKIKKGDAFEFENLKIEILDDFDFQKNFRLAKLYFEDDLFEILEKIGHVPLPPYIKRADEKSDKEKYQTVYAKTVGSVAAPTAGLHFTENLLQKLTTKGVSVVKVTLHVGPGTFLPIKTKNSKDHKMHSENFSISDEACKVINEAKANGKKITAVGTTTTRVLETLAQQSIKLKPRCAITNIFIFPPFEFKIVDRLITNFHQPESTLLMLVSAFAGREFILSSYEQAIKESYRLFSYGDAMIIL